MMSYNKIAATFKANCEALGSKTAYAYGDTVVSYQELDDRAERIASALAQRVDRRFVESDTPVRIGLSLPRDSHYISCIAATVRLGASYVPLDVALPEGRKQFIIDDADIAFMIDESNIDQLMQAPIADELPCWHKAFSEVYLLYTSGTTGKPKGVSITYDAVYTFLQVMSDPTTFNISQASRILHFTSFNFDLSISEIFSSLYYGASMIVALEKERRDTAKLCRLINAERATFMVMTPSVFVAFPTYDLPTLDCIYLCGEPVPVSLTQKAYGKSRYRLLNCYGPTETTVFVSAHIISGPEDNQNIGQPLPGTEFVVVDEDNKAVAAGGEGELLIGGRQVGNGYWHRPEQNEKSFITYEGRRFYRSGDIVHLNEDGSLNYIGRNDSQIKLNGFRIELSEITNRIEMHPRVAQALVQVERTGLERSLVVYVRTTDGSDGLTDIREYASEHLAHYMIPKYWNHVREFHLNVSRKIDRTKLRNEAWYALQHNDSPLTDMQGVIMREVARIMDMDEINIDLDLFDEVGLTSLYAMKVPVCLSVQGLILTVDDMYRYRTIRAIADNHRAQKSFWYNDPQGDTTKPVIVVISGYSSFDFLYRDWAERLKDKFSIFVLDSYFTFLQFRIVTGTELLEMYHEELKKILGTYRIAAYTGLCMGGEQALALAHMLHKDDAIKPTVLVLDGLPARDGLEEHYMPLDWTFFTDEQNALLLKQQLSFIGTIPPFRYEGPVVSFLVDSYRSADAFDALISSPTEEQLAWDRYCFDQAPQWWREAYPHCRIVTVPGNHYVLLHTKESVDAVVPCYEEVIKTMD